MKKSWVTLTLVFMSILVFTSVGVAGKSKNEKNLSPDPSGKDKVDVCHITGTYDFGEGEVPTGHVISIAEAALLTHRKHGDTENWTKATLPNGREVCYESVGVCHITGTYDFGEGEVPIGTVKYVPVSYYQSYIDQGDFEAREVFLLPDGREVCYEFEDVCHITGTYDFGEGEVPIGTVIHVPVSYRQSYIDQGDPEAWEVVALPDSSLACTPATLEPIADNPFENLASGGVSNALSALFEGANVPLADFAADQVSGLIMSLIFGGGPDPSQEILDDLNDMSTTLDNIETKLDTISKQLNDLESALNISTQDIEKEIITNGLNPFVGNIHSMWTQYLALHNEDGTWVTDQKILNDQTSAILDTLSGMWNQLIHIHDGLTGEASYDTSVLHHMAESFKSKVNAGGDPLNFYLLLESYFGNMLKAESHAATLMVEALRYRDTSQSQLGDYPQNAAFFMNRYQELINDQVEHFLNAVEYYVTATAYPARGLADFVPAADTIFMRADLLAAWLSTLHRPDPDSDAGGQELLVYRVIGSPLRVETFPEEFSDSKIELGGMLYHFLEFNQYSIPTYEKTSHHSWTDLTASPYVQFHPGQKNGSTAESGVISDASAILLGKYYGTDVRDAYAGCLSGWMDYYLQDFQGHDGEHFSMCPLNSAGEVAEALWATNTSGHPGAYYVMQGDGNFEIRDADNNLLWETHTNNHPGAYYVMQNDGNFVIYDPDNNPLWATGTSGHPGAYFVMQNDGNFVIYPNPNDSKYLNYGHVLDIQHPPALLKGYWYLDRFHDDQSGLDSIGVWPAGEPKDTNTFNVNWVPFWSYLHVDAWPTTYCQDYQGSEMCYVDGNFRQEVANRGWYKWVGSDSLTLEAHYTVNTTRTMYNAATPGTRRWGVHFRTENYTTLDSDPEFEWFDDFNSGSKQIPMTTNVVMKTDSSVYVLVGPRSEVDWEHTYYVGDDWDHWNAKITVDLIDLQFFLK